MLRAEALRELRLQMRRRALAPVEVVPIHPSESDPAMTRTTSRTVRFTCPFVLKGVGEQPAGLYEIETDETPLPGLSFPVYRRLETRMTVPLREMGVSGSQRVPIDPEELDAALAKDSANAAGG